MQDPIRACARKVRLGPGALTRRCIREVGRKTDLRGEIEIPRIGVPDPIYMWNPGLDGLCIVLPSALEWRGDQELTDWVRQAVDVLGNRNIRGSIGVVLVR